jgi:hypothetical protein
MTAWHAGCPVAISDLRFVSLTYWGFDGRPHDGHLVVNRDAVRPVVRAMRSLYDVRFPIRRMVLVDRYGADDKRSMAADNTSAFNCRLVEHSTSWSQHAYGRAIDINPLENPYIVGKQVLPPAGRAFMDRLLRRTGMIRAGDAVVRAFAAVGWRGAGPGRRRRTISTSPRTAAKLRVSAWFPRAPQSKSRDVNSRYSQTQPKPYVPAMRSASSRTSSAAGRPTTLR